MADEIHLHVIRQGSGAWNEWRRDNPDVTPDLTGVSLKGCQLSNLRLANADLSLATLRRANMRGSDMWRTVLNLADLSEANLSRSFLGRVHMHSAILRNTDLSFTRFECSDLSGANFSHARLFHTSFNDCDLAGADFSHALIKQGIFANVDLSQVQGLETARFLGPSTLGVDTLQRSGGALPLEFLRGCGLHEEIARCVPPLDRGELQARTCYICHSALDRVFCNQLSTDMQAAGARCWLLPDANTALPGGANELPAPAKSATSSKELRAPLNTRMGVFTDDLVGACDKLLVVSSRTALETPEIIREIERVLEIERRENRQILVCATRDDHLGGWQHDSASVVRERCISDFRHWEKRESYERALGKVLKALVL